MRSLSVGHVIIRIVICAAILALCIFSALFVNDIIGYAPLLIYIIAIILAAINLIISALNVHASLSLMAGQCRRGTTVPLNVSLRNSAIIPCFRLDVLLFISDLFGEDDMVTTRSFVVGVRQTRSVAMDVRFDHVGCYTAGVRALRVYDLFGLFCRTVRVSKECEVEVLPQIVTFEEVPVDEEASSESDAIVVPVANEGMDYSGVREYVMGDPLKSIHWKLSARIGSHLTRLYESYSTPSMCVFVDTYAPAYRRDTLTDIFDVLVEAAFSFAVFANNRGIDFEMQFVDRQGELRQFDAQECESTAEVLREIPRIEVGDMSADLRESIEAQAASKYGSNNLVLCTAHIDDTIIDLLAQVKQAQKSALLLAVVPLAEKRSERERYLQPLGALEELQVPYMVVTGVDELESDVWA